MKDFFSEINIDNLKSLSWWASWLEIVLGATILAAGFVFFINPYNLIPGGVYGASIVVHNLIPSLQVGTISYFFDIPLMIIAIVFLGGKLGLRTIVACLITPAIMNLLSSWSYPSIEALHALDPKQLLGGVIDMSDDLMLACIMGPLLIGIGDGLIVRSQATSGGTDIVAMILQKYCHIRFSNGILLVDCMVVLFGLLVIGMGIGTGTQGDAQSWKLSLYSLITIFISSRVLAVTINGYKDDKMMFIVSSHENRKLKDYILNNLDRTATRIKSSGLYSGEDKDMLLLVVRKKEVTGIQHLIHESDPDAFIMITDAYDTFGERWKDIPSRNSIIPE